MWEHFRMRPTYQQSEAVIFLMSNELTFTERNDYTKRLHQLKKWKDDTLQSAIDLKHIRDTKAYREDHSTFEEFCLKELEISRPHAYRIINFAEQKQLGSSAENERQSRDSKMSPMGDKIDDSEPKSDQIVQLDCTGYKITKTAMIVWERVLEAKELIQQVSKIRSIIKKSEEQNDILFREINHNGLLADLSNVIGRLKLAVPFAVCTSCQGHNSDKCTLCSGRGMISEFAFNSHVPAEMKLVRSKAIAKASK